MNHWVNRRVSSCKQLLPSVFGRIGAFVLFVLCSLTVAHAELGMQVIHEVYGDDYETIRQIPGRPWVEVQYRYERDGVMISCNFAAGRCLWIDYWSKGTEIDESYLFNELERLFPGLNWVPVDTLGNMKRWLNADDDRVTLRSTGFTLHMNEYIRNVLSRRARWQF